MKHIIIVLSLLAVTACAATPQGGVQGQAPAAGTMNPASGSQSGSR
jgi:hypothetical protein